MKTLATMLVIVCFLFISWVPCQAADEAVYICKNSKTGTPRLVKSPNLCKAKTEYLITLTSGNQGPQGPQGPSGSSGGVKVYAANSQYLGDLVEVLSPTFSEGGLMIIYIPSLHKTAAIGSWEYKKGEFADIDKWPVEYETTNCTGKPYTYNIYDLFKGPDGKYYTAKNGNPTTVYINAAWYADDWGCHREGGNEVVVEAIEVTTLPFTVPIPLPLRFE
jgi:hypothetical protein